MREYHLQAKEIKNPIYPAPIDMGGACPKAIGKPEPALGLSSTRAAGSLSPAGYALMPDKSMSYVAVQAALCIATSPSVIVTQPRRDVN